MNNKTWLLIGGILSLLGGLYAFAYPFAATLTVEWLAAWAFLFSGAAAAASAFGHTGGIRWMTLLTGIFTALLGVFLLNNPLQGAVSLTVIAGLLLLLAGAVRIVSAFAAQNGLRWVLLASGGLSLLLAVMIFSNFPASALTLLGTFLALELLSNGISLLFLAFAKPRA
ncbi:MAG: DUF308 domain-containing protein [Neisseria sp.]|nr:DUF308 domain-containing protein [Neisseria sp.]